VNRPTLYEELREHLNSASVLRAAAAGLSVGFRSKIYQIILQATPLCQWLQVRPQRDEWVQAAAKRGSQNLAGISDPVIDALIDKIIAAR
jgi:hypothetical protein